jgi:hypothetical protein
MGGKNMKNLKKGMGRAGEGKKMGCQKMKKRKMKKRKNGKKRGVEGSSRSAKSDVQRRRTGFVARLGKVVRDEINGMLLDGMSYPKICKALARKGIVLRERSIRSWRSGGYQDWLQEQERLSQGERMMASALKVVKENHGTVIQEAGLQLAASQIYQVLMDFDPKVLKKKLNKNAEGYAKLVHVMARLSEGGLKYERYRAEVAERKEKILKELQKAKEGGLTKERLRRIEGNLNLL